MAELGTTRYGMQLRFLDANDKSSTRSYNGINFTSDESTAKANELALFLRGGNSYSGFADLLGETSTLSEVAVTQNNALSLT